MKVMQRRVVVLVMILAALAWWPAQAAGQDVPVDDPDMDLVPLQPEFSIIAMPTALRLPRYKSAFRITHRFARPLGSGDFGDLAEDLFGIDAGAQIGLEYRFGIMRGAQIGIHRTSDRTIELFAQYDLLQERNGRWVNMAVIGTIDGTNNFRDRYTPAIGFVVSRSVSPIGTLFLQPIWVNNSNPLPSELVSSNDSFILGIGTRLRIRPTVYLVGEIIPRTSGNNPGVNQGAFGIEKRAGGHMFQLNISNAFGTTIGQIARGGTSNNDWYLGFNISRKFF